LGQWKQRPTFFVVAPVMRHRAISPKCLGTSPTDRRNPAMSFRLTGVDQRRYFRQLFAVSL
jgi:hypothetical protein